MLSKALIIQLIPPMSTNKKVEPLWLHDRQESAESAKATEHRSRYNPVNTPGCFTTPPVIETLSTVFKLHWLCEAVGYSLCECLEVGLCQGSEPCLIFGEMWGCRTIVQVKFVRSGEAESQA